MILLRISFSSLGLLHMLIHAENSERAFYKELVKVIDASDVILEVLDARDPLGTRCLDMEKMVMRSGPGKHLVLLLNKIGIPFLILFIILYHVSTFTFTLWKRIIDSYYHFSNIHMSVLF